MNLPGGFWATVRSVSEAIGYADRKSKKLLIPDIVQIQWAFAVLELNSAAVVTDEGHPTEHCLQLQKYFTHRAAVLNDVVEKQLQDASEAERLYREVLQETKSKSPPTMNKQKGRKRKPAYLTCIVNMLLESILGEAALDSDPRRLVSFVRDGAPLRTLSRRVDGACPDAVNPIAIWEIKEYYHTTTFGSRVADGVYETMLDGMELRELREATGIQCDHCLFVDSHYTWWICGKSYLCRIIDMLHMGLLTEVLFGKEVITRLPELATEWKRMLTVQQSEISAAHAK
jgi:hypothetical protein